MSDNGRGERVEMTPGHPGGIIRDAIHDNQTTVTATAQAMGVSLACLHRILRGVGRIQPAHALALERLGWSTAEHWLRMQAAYDLAQLRREAA